MRFNLSSQIDRERFKRRSNELYKKGVVVELTEKTQRTLKQNAYLHLIIAYLALETGNSIDYAKREYFKIICNRDCFVRLGVDPILNKDVEYIRSSSDLTTEEMSVCIERFKNWSAQAGYRLPDADEYKFLQEIEIEIERNKQYL